MSELQMSYSSFILVSAKGQNLILSQKSDNIFNFDDKSNPSPMTIAEYLVNNSADENELA